MSFGWFVAGWIASNLLSPTLPKKDVVERKVDPETGKVTESYFVVEEESCGSCTFSLGSGISYYE